MDAATAGRSSAFITDFGTGFTPDTGPEALICVTPHDWVGSLLRA